MTKVKVTTAVTIERETVLEFDEKLTQEEIKKKINEMVAYEIYEDGSNEESISEVVGVEFTTPVKSESKLRLVLAFFDNFGVERKEITEVKDYSEASFVMVKHIELYMYSASSMGEECGDIIDEYGKKVACISYNGKIIEE